MISKAFGYLGKIALIFSVMLYMKSNALSKILANFPKLIPIILSGSEIMPQSTLKFLYITPSTFICFI
jgi:hypothetical protein